MAYLTGHWAFDAVDRLFHRDPSATLRELG